MENLAKTHPSRNNNHTKLSLKTPELRDGSRMLYISTFILVLYFVSLFQILVLVVKYF